MPFPKIAKKRSFQSFNACIIPLFWRILTEEQSLAITTLHLIDNISPAHGTAWHINKNLTNCDNMPKILVRSAEDAFELICWEDA